ncbi:MAG: hypothetical protein ACI37Q_00080 [Candidatus Gastranaerophilaceae bacterium]
MGMAASQARLLTITARLADNELKSQTINNAKMRLATQSSQASENYINALNNATMKFSSYDLEGNALNQDLTFNALTAYSSYNTQYGLVNSSNQLLVSEAEAAMFESSRGNLNAYLKAHGLEYTTTYFDKIGSFVNDKYPIPYNNISPEALKRYYEEYGSYENSVERENYEISYSSFNYANSQLSIGSQSVLKSYLLYEKNTHKVEFENGSYQIGAINDAKFIADAYNTYSNAFNNSNNTYNIENLKKINAISDTTVAEIQALINSISITDVGGKAAIKYAEKDEPNTKTNEDKSITYTFEMFSITTDANGIVTQGATATEDYSDATFGGKSATQQPLVGQSLSTYLNNLKITISETDDDGNSQTYESYMEAITDKNGKTEYYQYCTFTELEQAKEILQDAVDTIISAILAEANYEGFSDWLLEQDASTLKKYNINTDAPIEQVNNQTLEEILGNYVSAKEDFIGNIFDRSTPVQIGDTSYTSSYDYIEKSLKDGTIEPSDLTNIDYVLELIKDLGLKQSSSYDTIIKQFIVEEMISEFGEPKYAWVDENDTSNTGNADAKAQWYTNLFQRMSKGYKALENGLAASKEWIEYALESGIVSMEQVDKSFNWTGLAYKTCTRITEETDDAAVTKAEAEYNRAMNDIEAKDNIYDIQLKNIDTEHTSLQTEYDSIKGVISKNIDRTFKFNQSA